MSTLLDPEFLRANVWPRLSAGRWNAFFLPHYGFGRLPPADFHEHLAADLDAFHLRRGVGRAYVAPRDGAKSTWLTFAHTLRCVAEGRERHVVLLAETGEQAELYLTNIKAELEGNERLAFAYPGACGPGPEWSTSRARLNNGVQVEAFGRGARIRGRRNRQSRPSLIVLDDAQGLKDVISPTERKHAWDWFTRDVIPAGDERTNFLLIGSAVHREAIVVRAMSLPGWVGRTFRAVHSYPERLDLWDECLRLATNLADPDRIETARRYYQGRRAEMDAGSLTYWPEKWSLYDLMTKRGAVGHAAFEAEYQGNPHSGEGAEWPPEYFDWPGFWFDAWPPPEEIVLSVQAIDPSKGTGSKGADYQAHVRLGLGKDGTIYVEADLRREANYVGRMVDLAAAWRPNVCVAESNNTMGLLVPEIERQLAERRRSGRPVALNYEERRNSVPKLARIRLVGGYLARRQIRVRNTPGGRLLVDQWRDVPNGEFDDGPDAVATALDRLERLINGEG